MDIITLSGTVSASSTLPTFYDVFPDLVSPKDIIAQDKFSDGYVGGLEGTTLSNGLVWTRLNSNAVYLKVAAGGYVYADTETTTSGMKVTDANIKRCYTSIEWGGSGFAGILFRMQDTTNHYQITIGEAGDGLRVEKKGTNPQIYTAALGLVVGKRYDIGVNDTGSQLLIYVNGILELTIDDAVSVGSSVGLSARGAANKIYELVIGK